MFFKADNFENKTIETPRGGKGSMNCKYAFGRDNAPDGSAFCLCASMELPAGSSIGLHTHHDDEEIYAILSGNGIFTDNDGTQIPVKVGDVTLTKKGESHALENTGNSPLIFMAVLAKK